MDDENALVEKAARREEQTAPISRVGGADRTDAQIERQPINSVEGRTEQPSKKQKLRGMLKKGGATLVALGVMLVMFIFIIPINLYLMI